jgi:hypothetical protein
MGKMGADMRRACDYLFAALHLYRLPIDRNSVLLRR